MADYSAVYDGPFDDVHAAGKQFPKGSTVSGLTLEEAQALEPSPDFTVHGLTTAERDAATAEVYGEPEATEAPAPPAPPVEPTEPAVEPNEPAGSSEADAGDGDAGESTDPSAAAPAAPKRAAKGAGKQA